MSHSAFSVELMNEIFRCSELATQDLANCCLLSRRYLQGARQWLYKDVQLYLVQKEEELGSRLKQGTQYDISTWRLLQTLSNNAELQQYVRDVLYGVSDRDPSGIWTLASDAFHNFFALTPSVRRLHFDQGQGEEFPWSGLNLYELTVDQRAQVEGLHVGEMTEEIARILSSFKSLKCLSLWTEEDASNIPENNSPSNLQSLYISYSPNYDFSDFLRLSTNTLARLYVPLNVFLALDYTRYPNLTHLGVSLEVTRVTAEEVKNATEAWSAFSRSNVSTLAFDGQAMDVQLEGRLFGSEQLFLTHAPPTLRRIEFIEEVLLDRMYWMLKRDNVEELVISDAALDPLMVELIRTLCEAGGKQLIRYTGPWYFE